MKLFIREPITVIFTLALPIIFLFVLGGVFGNEADTGDGGMVVFRGVGPLDYYIPAYFALVMMAIGTVALPVHLAGYRERGVLRRLRASSISVWSVLGSQLVVSFVIAVVGSILIFIMGVIVYSPNMPQEIGLLIPAFLLGLVSFTAFGFFLGAVLPSTRAAQGLGLILFFVMMILGGAGPTRGFNRRDGYRGTDYPPPPRHPDITGPVSRHGMEWTGIADSCRYYRRGHRFSRPFLPLGVIQDLCYKYNEPLEYY